MTFLRRLLAGGRDSDPAESEEADPAESEASEREYELEVLRAEAERMDELTQRQLRFARYSWEPPAQGGERRADDSVD